MINWATVGRGSHLTVLILSHDAVASRQTSSPSCRRSSGSVSPPSAPPQSSFPSLRLPGPPKILLPKKACSDARPPPPPQPPSPSRRQQPLYHREREREQLIRRDGTLFADDGHFRTSRAAVPSSAATYATLREIEDRLKSIRNIEKITNTMKIVASTKLTRAQRAMNTSRKYGQTSNEVYQSAETKALDTEDKKTLIVVCSSDKGLCGGIHSSLARYVRRLAAEENFDLVIVGEKAKAQLSRTNAKSIQLSFAGIGKDVPTFADAQAIADQIVQLPTEYTDIKILYNSFLNAQSYEASIIEAFSEEAITQSREF